jgi:antitoxin (DNA-binding transcriptional repressor) of toxin-antitoxin stability system
LVIVEKNRPVARLTAEPATSEEPRRPGSAKGILTIHEDDVGEALTAQMESAMQAGWSDSLMDEYNDYDSHRGQA